MDRSELATRRVLIVGGKPHAVTTLRNVLGLAGITQVDAVSDSKRAIKFLIKHEVDAVFFDETVGPTAGLPFPLAARRTEHLLNPMMPIYMTCSAPMRRQVEGARDDGITDVLVRPISAATVIRKLLSAFGAPRAFIMAGDFFGPDRRGGGRAPFEGVDRRRRTPKKLSGRETQAFLSGAREVPEAPDSTPVKD